MSGRVNPAAENLGSETIQWPDDIKSYRHGEPTQEGLQYNEQWIKGRIQEGYIIYDIGPKGNAPSSPYYNVELNTIQNFNYEGSTYRVIVHYKVLTIGGQIPRNYGGGFYSIFQIP